MDCGRICGEIKELILRINVKVNHTLREGNKLADNLANYALDAGPIEAHCFEELDIQSNRIVQNDKLQCPYLRIRVARRQEMRRKLFSQKMKF